MTTPILSHHQIVGDFVFGSPIYFVDPSSYQEHLVPPSPFPLETPLSMVYNPIIEQPGPTPITDATFSQEAFTVSPTSTDTGFGFIQTPATHHVKAPIIPESQGRLHNAQSMVDEVPNPIRQTKKRKQSQLSTDMSEGSRSEMLENLPGRKKRGRKPKAPSNNRATEQLKEEDEGNGLPKNPQLERNRVAATRCRLRKRDEALALTSQEQAVEDQHRYLSSYLESLTAEIYHLKTQLLRHTDCNCILIQRYITNEAKKTVDRLILCPSQQGTSNSGASPSDSSQTTSPESDFIYPLWLDPFHPVGPMSDTGEKIFKTSMEPSLVAITPGQQMACPTPFHGCETEMNAHI